MEDIIKGRRYCFTILESQKDENGYIPSLVIEGEKGHRPMTGNGLCAAPWYWGKTLKEAEAVADAKNEELGISKEEAFKIVGRSMFG